jgi:hypothetical protein
MAQSCLNIGPRERAMRVRVGVGLLFVTGITAASLLFAQAARPYRALVFLPLLLACISLLQVRAKTCVLLATRRKKNLDDGEVVVSDAAEQRQLAAQARGVIVQALGLAGLATAAFYLW